VTIRDEAHDALRPPFDIEWSTASPARRATALGLDYERLSKRADRVRRLTPFVAISAAVAVALAVPVIRMLGRPTIETNAPVAALFLVGIGFLLGYASVLVGVMATSSISRRFPGGPRWIPVVIVVVVSNVAWIGAIALAATMEIPGAMWLVPPGIIAAQSVGVLIRVQTPLNLLREPTDEALAGLRAWLGTDPRSNGTGGLGWIVAHAAFSGVVAAAAAILVFRFGALAGAPLALVALIAIDVLSVTLEARDYRVAVTATGVVALGAVWLTASVT